MHYTYHVNGVHHKKLIPRTNKWFYHNGKQEEGGKTSGFLTCQDAKLEIKLREAKLRPYILIYQVNNS